MCMYMYMYMRTHIRCSIRQGPICMHEFADYADCVTCVAKGTGDGQQGVVLLQLVGLVIATLLFQQVRSDVQGLEGVPRGGEDCQGSEDKQTIKSLYNMTCIVPATITSQFLKIKVYILLQNFLSHNDSCVLFYTTKIISDF